MSDIELTPKYKNTLTSDGAVAEVEYDIFYYTDKHNFKAEMFNVFVYDEDGNVVNNFLMKDIQIAVQDNGYFQITRKY